MKKILILISILVVGLCGFLVFSYKSNYRERWTSRTSPLPESTIVDLCDRLQLDQNNKLCGLEKDVYAGDFYLIIRKRIQPNNQDWMDYNQVNELLGPYLEDECLFDPGSEGTISCYYDLRGDKVYYIGAHFDSNGKLKKLFTPFEKW